MKPSEVETQLINHYKARTSIFIWGAPGVGKSDIVRKVRNELDIGLIDQRLSQCDPTDLKGLPYLQDGKMSFAVPSFLPQEERDGEWGFLFLDELNTAPQTIQAASYQLILDGRLGDYILPPGWICVAAGNRAEDRAIAIRLSSAISNRFGHVDFEVDQDEWKMWARTHGIDQGIISFINWRPELLHNMDPNQRAFPTPRTWEMLNKHIPFLTPDSEYNTYKSFVGEGAAGEFFAFKKIERNLVTFDQVMKDPKNTPVPEDVSTLYAMSGMLSAKATQKNFNQLMKYIKRMAIEYQTVFITDALAIDQELADHADFTKWSLENHNVLL